MVCVNQVFLFITCSTIALFFTPETTTVIPLLIALTTTSLITFFEGIHYKRLLVFGYILLSFFYPMLIVFFPVIIYDKACYTSRLGLLSVFFMMCYHFTPTSLPLYVLLCNLGILGYLLSRHTHTIHTLTKNYTHYQDATKETERHLQHTNKALLEKQDYEIHVATLNERNRIARDIHDHVGHMLSRCLLQVGALTTLVKDPTLATHLKGIQDTLTESMNCIRKSIHNLHDTSTPLSTEVAKLVDDFVFCPITFHSTMEDTIPAPIKYAFIAIVKEGLSNIIRHSDATEVTLFLRTHPAFYQLILHDNGSTQPNTFTSGIGLQNITQRVHSLGGTCSIQTEDGFKLFITIPKEVL